MAAARKGFAAWSKATPYNRGQVIYRVAEMLDGRRAQFTELIMVSTGASEKAAAAEVDAAVDRLVHYAGWTDKLAALLGSANPVSGPFFSYSAPEPTGVVGVLAPTGAPLLGLVSVLAPVLATGNASVVVAAEADPCVAVTFAEVLATSDVPGGVVNLLTGSATELGPHLAAHADVNALDLTGADAELRVRLEQAAAETVKRVYVPKGRAGLRRALPAPPDCAPSWRSRRSGTRSARCRCRWQLLLSSVLSLSKGCLMSVERESVVLLAGPSGSGKSRVARLAGRPQLALDDFYRDLDHPGLPAGAAASWTGTTSPAGTPRPPSPSCAAVPDGSGRRPSLRHRRQPAHRHRPSRSRGEPTASSPRVSSHPTWSRRVRRPDWPTTRSTSTGPGLSAWSCASSATYGSTASRIGVLWRRGLALWRAEPDLRAYALARGCRPVTLRKALAIIGGDDRLRPREPVPGGSPTRASQARTRTWSASSTTPIGWRCPAHRSRTSSRPWRTARPISP